MAYTKQTWTDPTEAQETAARFNHIEDGIEAAHDKLLVLNTLDNPPVGAQSGTVLVRLNPAGIPLTSVETAAYQSSGDEFTVGIPTAVEIGDVLLLLCGSRSSSSSLTGPAGWEEIWSYYATQNNKVAAWVYRVINQAALDALDATVTVPVASTPDDSVRMGMCLRVTNARLNSTWPVYSSGVNRSPGTLDNNTAAGFDIRAITTLNAAFNRVFVFAMTQTTEANAVGHTAAGYTEVAKVQYTTTDDTLTFLFTLLQKTQSAGPVGVQSVVVPNPGPGINSGGAQWIIPTEV